MLHVSVEQQLLANTHEAVQGECKLMRRRMRTGEEQMGLEVALRSRVPGFL